MQQRYPVPEGGDRDRALANIFRRRWRFFEGYLNAQARSKTVARLLPILKSSFSHPWVAGVDLKIRFWPGGENALSRLYRLYLTQPRDFMTWDGPITVSVFRERRGKKRQALCMSLFLISDTLQIAQIQGVFGTDLPKDLRGWPKLFIEACLTFARQENLRQVRVPMAASLYSYRRPFLREDLLPKARERTLQRIRVNMALLYDKNAIELGFVPDGDSYKWENLRMSSGQIGLESPLQRN